MELTEPGSTVPWWTMLLRGVLTLAVNVVLELRGLIVQVAIAAFLAVAADPAVRRLERRGIGRGRAVAAVMIGAFAFVAIVFAVLVPPLVEQGNRFIDAAPGIVEDTRDSRLFRDLDKQYDVVDRASEQAASLPGLVSDQLGTVFGAVAAGVLGTLTILFLVVFLLLGGGQVVEGTVRVFPKLAERRWWTIVQGAYSGIAAYVGGAIVIALCGGTVLAITAAVLGLPYALPLGLWMMLLEIIPMIGATIGAIPAVIVAFVAGGVVEGIVVLAFLVVYQQIENTIIQPRIQSHVVQLPGIAIFFSVLVGGELLGVLGALIAVPIASIVQIIVKQVLVASGRDQIELPQLFDEAGRPILEYTPVVAAEDHA